MSKKFFKLFFSMSFLLLFGKALGFIRTALIASTYGAGFITDLYSFEDSFINEVYSIFSTFLACSFIPRYLLLDAEGKNPLYNIILNLGLVIMIVITAACLIFTKPLLHILVPGFFDIYDISKVVFITRINLFMLIITFLVNYIMVVLQAHEVFLYLALEGLILNLITIAYLFCFPQAGVLGLLLCRILAYSLLLIIVFLKLHKVTPLKYKFMLSIKDKDLIDMAKLSMPMLGITVLWQLNYVVDKSMASGLQSGSIACLNYANTISMIIYNVIGYIVSTYAYPTLSKNQSNPVKIDELFKNYLLLLLQLVLPVFILTVFFSGYISAFLYGHGNMANGSVEVIARILTMYLPGSVAYCIKNLYSKLFYIKQNTKVVLYFDIIGCLTNIALNLILVKIMGVYGLALATSISYCVTVIFQVAVANKKKYTSLRWLDMRSCCVRLIILIMAGAVSNCILNLFLKNRDLQFLYIAVIYLI